MILLDFTVIGLQGLCEGFYKHHSFESLNLLVLSPKPSSGSVICQDSQDSENRYTHVTSSVRTQTEINKGKSGMRGCPGETRCRENSMCKGPEVPVGRRVIKTFF